ncbi:homeobox and c2h2 transcription factor [Sporothrix brasiliensis 5110]|uniref:Homeobox and c2h2 transcription factor n=1 Tax=Sporothrix brasiliensis 5110 TaxID=1398154 RepID=A0A0C2EUH0_9PEZI|nr:homeobox and c2h2 transcription factor [Sporothrix brasiliensis 5110]KIH90179.1 homeobox and c2h2 transcription factor [Sporothrix brasiliensis 5110]
MPVIPEEYEGSPGGSMDDFVNWDASASAAERMVDGHDLVCLPPDGEPIFPDQALDAQHLLVSPQLQHMNDREAALLFENPDADDFSFWALEHYEQSNNMIAGLDLGGHDVTAAPITETDATVESLLHSTADSMPLDQADDLLSGGLYGVPDEPCVHCKQGGYQCKTIQEGNYKGYCTSCVALRCECSFGLVCSGPLPTDLSFPTNPWPTLGDHPDPIPHDEEADAVARLYPSAPADSSTTELPDLVGNSSPNPFAAAQPKLGARFSRESVRILKNWVSTHSRHPYPTEDEKESLQRLTGLNKTQISNWLANARRRGKIPTTRSTSPHVRNTYAGPNASIGAIDIPQPRRSGTPSPFDRRPQTFENIPLQRWANSPPENEPASVSDIARAITSSASAISSGLNSPLSLNFTDDGSGRSLFNGSSASSLGTSQSSGTGSFASAYSHASRNSFGSNFSSLERGRRRRRRRSAPTRGVGSGSGGDREEKKMEKKLMRQAAKLTDARSGPTSLVAPLKTYQCTFCTETFKTKHDWQRHEKSLHLSLERWVCTPQGATAVHPETKQVCCVFCGEVEPDTEHIESHNFAACQERALGDRTFYRKDHLRQHLKLVHSVKFMGWSMDQWKVATPEIRSRCGFCGIAMDTWTFRIDHLAEHFKTGRTMADWKGDWGFDKPVLEMVENSIPPYLIHDERNSPLPFSATSQPPGSPRNAYELFRSELSYWIQHQEDQLKTFTDDEMRVEACRIVFAAELTAMTNQENPSWLRDLVMGDEDCARQARMSPIRTPAESRMASMRIKGQETLFDMCPLETALHEFVRDRSQLGLTPMDSELQMMACDLIRKMEIQLIEGPGEPVRAHITTEKKVVEFWLRMIKSSTQWLSAFRKRAHLPRSDAIADEARRPVNEPSNIDATIHNYSRLEAELADFVRLRREAGDVTLDDATLQRQARLIIYELDDGWNQTAADDPQWLDAFKSRHITKAQPATSSRRSGSLSSGSAHSSSQGQRSARSTNMLVPSPFFLNDTNCYRRLARELTRFVNMVMSPNNPNSHVPTDEELQHQARWILYDDDDPWNQTAADNAEWLMRFKRDVGILPAEDGPGLPTDFTAWSVSQGGSGFAPPYCFPKMPIAPFPSPEDEAGDASSGMSNTSATQMQNTTMLGIDFELPSETANKFLQSFTTRYAKPATVFCSRELENGLTDYVRTTVAQNGQPFPDDEALRAKAREILGRTTELGTPADDKELLVKFKEMVRGMLTANQTQQGMAQLPTMPEVFDMNLGDATAMNLANNHQHVNGMPLDMGVMNVDLNLDSVTQEDMDNLLQDMNFEFEDGVDLINRH